MIKYFGKLIVFLFILGVSNGASAISVADSVSIADSLNTKMLNAKDSIKTNTLQVKNDSNIVKPKVVKSKKKVVKKKPKPKTVTYDVTTWEGTVRYLKHYLKNKPQNQYEADLHQQVKYFLKLLDDKRLKRNVTQTKSYLDKLDVHKLITSISILADSLQQNKNKYNEYREIKSILGDNIINYYDKEGISSENDNFDDLLDYISEPDSTKRIDITSKKWKVNYVSDTLITSVRNMVQHVNTDSVFIWLKEQQNDTLDLYIRNIDNDSVPIRLYKNNPQLIPINISDFWGRDVSAIIRDIGNNSFRLLIDKTPQLYYQDEERVKDMLSNQYNIYDLRNSVTVSGRPVPNPYSNWRFYGNASLDATQILLHQWNKGGQSSIAFLANVELYLKYKKDKHNLDSYAKFKLGFIRQGDYSDSKASFETNTDIIDIQAKYGYQIYEKTTFATVFGNFKTQFAPSYEHVSDTQKVMVSKFLNPAQITFALGLNTKLKYANLFFSPLSSKTTIVASSNIDVTKHGLEEGKNTRYELGAIFKGKSRYNIWGDIVMENTLELFANYLKNIQNVDIIWDMKLIFPINDYIKTTIATSFIYDDDKKVPKKADDGTIYQSKGGQFRQMFTIGFYTFF